MIYSQTTDIPEAVKTLLKFGETGAEIRVDLPQGEAVLLIKEQSLNEINPHLQDVDYAILEGFEREKVLSKIVIGKSAKDVLTFLDGLSLAISGPIAQEKSETKKVHKAGIPVLNDKTQLEQLVDIVEQKAFNILPNLPDCTKAHTLGECGYPSCYVYAKAIVSGKSMLRTCPLEVKEDCIVEVNGIRLPLKDFPKKIVRNTLFGLLSSLHGSGKIRTIKIEIKEDS